MKDLKPKTVSDYIQIAPKESQEILNQLKTLVESAVPKAEGGISWNVPIYNYNGILAGFDVAKKYLSFGIDCLNDEDREILKQKDIKQENEP